MTAPDTDIPTIEFGRLPRRRRSWPWEMAVLSLVSAWALVAPSYFYYWGESYRPQWYSDYGEYAKKCAKSHADIDEGAVAYRAGDFAKASAAFTSAIETDGGFDAIWIATFNRAQSTFAAGAYEAAIRDYTAILETHLNHAQDQAWIPRVCRWKRAIAREHTGDVLAASRDLYDLGDQPRPTAAEMCELAAPSLGPPAQESYLAW